MPALDSEVLPVLLLFAQHYDEDSEQEDDNPRTRGPQVELFTLRLDEAAQLYFMDVENIGQIGSDHPLEGQYRLRSTLLAQINAVKTTLWKYNTVCGQP